METALADLYPDLKFDMSQFSPFPGTCCDNSRTDGSFILDKSLACVGRVLYKATSEPARIEGKRAQV